jgi:hypothetical protein
MKITVTQSICIAAASSLILAGSAIAKPPGSSGSSPGNSAFGHSQSMGPVTGPGNSTFGHTTSENARLKNNDIDDQDDQDRETKTKKLKAIKTHKKTKAPGNSAFGHNQRLHRVTGSTNSTYGRTKAEMNKNKKGE